MSLAELTVAFFLQMLIIVAACRAMGWIMKRFFDQPQVIGGVIPGPSPRLLVPDLQAAIFPKDSKAVQGARPA